METLPAWLTAAVEAAGITAYAFDVEREDKAAPAPAKTRARFEDEVPPTLQYSAQYASETAS